ncbi:MAG TPA: DUF1579 domain-containing protein [Bacteroidota bacterium]|nr:DUF1579 domain-containing protein [Bacteroidota bacterium]
MKLIHVLTAFSAVFTMRAAAQDTPPPPPAMDDAMMKFIEASSPNENHKKLDGYLGTWDTQSSFWMDGPDKPPATSRGLSKNMRALGGRFVRQEFKGYFMGMPMDGLGFTGYDNMKKLYTMFWIDNTSTAMFTGAGTFDATGTTLTMTGKTDDPMTGEKDKTAKFVIRMTGKDRYVFEMYEVPAKGADVKVGEILYTRAQEHR